jgi:predicted aspartyl protease
MLDYDLGFDPPAPVASVRVAHPVTGLASNILRGKLDTAADLTVIPERLLVPLGLSAKRHVWTRSYDGTYSQRAVYYVALAIEGHRLPTVRCIAADRDTVLVGRNVLNRFVLTLDGRQLMFELQPV